MRILPSSKDFDWAGSPARMHGGWHRWLAHQAGRRGRQDAPGSTPPLTRGWPGQLVVPAAERQEAGGGPGILEGRGPTSALLRLRRRDNELSRPPNESLGVQSVLAVQVQQPVAIHDARLAIKDEHHEDVAILGTDQDVLEAAGRHAVSIFDSTGRAIVPLEVGGWD